MCGILFLYNHEPNQKIIDTCLESGLALQPRGPDHTTIIYDPTTFMCFQRLAINDLTDAGSQPMFHDNTYLLCNGEIYNSKNLNSLCQLPVTSKSDCETILHLYHMYVQKFPEKNVLTIAKEVTQALDGEFAFVIYDKNKQVIIASRDPFGVRPLFWYTKENYIGFASELKGIYKMSQSVRQFPPGSVMVYHCQTGEMQSDHYTSFPIEYSPANFPEDFYASAIRKVFTKAVTKRLMSDRPVCALLSGGLDSSLVASIVAKHIAPRKLDTYCIGFEGAPDLHYANLVAKHIGSNHHVVQVKEQDFLDAIEETIKVIESYDITSVRASVGNLLISKYIAKTSDCKVVFNGDYSDEVCGGYLYLKKAPTLDEFHKECSSLVENICYFDSLRSDRTISSQGLEARVPFSDKHFVNFYMSIHPSLRVHKPSEGRMEKYLLRKAFEHEDLLPDEVLWRSKAAFSDAVSKPERSWHNIVKAFIETKISDEEFSMCKDSYTFNTPPTKEAYYYRKIFEEYYPKMGHVIPKFWLPKWTSISDPSAREL